MTPRRFINLLPKKYFFLKTSNFFKFQYSRYNNFKNINYLPVTMDIEPTTGCNFRCTMCQVSSPSFEAKNMDLETFKKIINENKQLIKIKLQGMGEPLVNKYIYEMISYASDFGISTEIICNGSMLNQKNISKLMKNNLSKLTISIDGASKKVFEKIRVKSDFEVVVDNAKNFRKNINEKFIRPEFSAWSTIQAENLDEIEDIAMLCKEIGFDDLTYQVFLTGCGKEEWNKVNNRKNINYENIEIKKRFDHIISKYSSKKFVIKVFEENLLNYKKKCSWPWNSAYLSAKGEVVPCCIVGDPKVVNFGNINSSSFKQIWNSKQYNELRKKISSNDLEDYCKNCYLETKQKV